MNEQSKFSPEVRERAVRMVREHRGEYSSQWSAVQSIAGKIGCTSKTLLAWVKRDDVDSGEHNGVTSAVSVLRHWSVRLRSCAAPTRS
jgi:transposase